MGSLSPSLVRLRQEWGLNGVSLSLVGKTETGMGSLGVSLFLVGKTESGVAGCALIIR